MSPTPFHPKTEITTNVNKGQPPLKINRDSHSIKKTSPSSSWSSSSPLSSVNKTQQRQPVIIYTHSPKIIQTHPKDFMELVQKLTGFSRSKEEEEEEQQKQHKQKHNDGMVVVAVAKEEVKVMEAYKEENETSSIIIEKNNCGCNFSGGMEDVKSCLAVPPPPPTLMEPPLIPYVKSMPVFAPISAEFLCSNKQFLTYADPLFF